MADDSLHACLAEIKAHPKQFYVYVISRPSGEPFYVGCGSGKRIARHEKEAETSARSRKLNIIRKIKRNGETVRYKLERWCATWAAAAEHECFLIKTIGRSDLGSGPLMNLTAGGDGFRDPGPKAKERKSEALKRRWTNSEYRKTMAQHAQSQWSDQEHRASHQAAVKTATNKPEWRKRRSEAARESWQNEEYRRRHAEASQRSRERRGVVRKPRPYKTADKALLDKKTLQSDASKRMWADPLFRERIAATRRVSFKQPAMIAKRSAATKAMWSDPKYREKVLTSRREGGKTNVKSGLAAMQAWHAENPELSRKHLERWSRGSVEWRKNNQEEFRRICSNAGCATARWAKENPDRAAAIRREASKMSGLSHVRKAAARKRCIEMLDRYAVSMPMPKPKAGWRAWESFEQELLSAVAR